MALRLGKTVKQLLSELDSVEITEWMAALPLLNAGGAPKSKTTDVKAIRASMEHLVKKRKKG